MLPVSSIILSGGLATRMKGVDKGLVLLQNKPLVQHVIKRIASQTNEIFINANREIAQYRSFGYPVLQDEMSGFLGPLAGFSLGLNYAKYEYILTVPCDSPLLPHDLVQRLMNQLQESEADIAVASSHGSVHPVFCLCKKNLLRSLTEYLANGERRVSAWQKSQRYIEVDFSDCNDAFVNLNSPEDLAALEFKLNQQTL